jgi:hypothetical protein
MLGEDFTREILSPPIANRLADLIEAQGERAGPAKRLVCFLPEPRQFSTVARDLNALGGRLGRVGRRTQLFQSGLDFIGQGLLTLDQFAQTGRKGLKPLPKLAEPPIIQGFTLERCLYLL